MRERGKIVGSARSNIERAHTFEIGDGDRALFHTTNIQTTRADSMYCVPYLRHEGAPPSFLIHSSPGGSENPHLTKKLLKHIITSATPEGVSAGLPQENGKVNRLGI